jgi:hypothetical protein
MDQPLGFIAFSDSLLACPLRRSFYGLKQSPCASLNVLALPRYSLAWQSVALITLFSSFVFLPLEFIYHSLQKHSFKKCGRFPSTFLPQKSSLPLPSPPNAQAKLQNPDAKRGQNRKNKPTSTMEAWMPAHGRHGLGRQASVLVETCVAATLWKPTSQWYSRRLAVLLLTSEIGYTSVPHSHLLKP